MQWVGGFVAGLLATAIIAGLVLSRDALGPIAGGNGPAPPELISPEGVAVGPDGTVYVSDWIGDRVFKIASGGRLVAVAGGGTKRDGPATQAWLNHPSALAVDGNGNLFIADSIAGTIRRVDRHGVITTVAYTDAPLGLAIDADGLLYAANYIGEIHVIDPAGASGTIDLSSLPAPAPQFSYIAFDKAGDLYAVDRAPVPAGQFATAAGGCRVIRLTRAQSHTKLPLNWSIRVVAGTGKCGYSGDRGPATSAELNNPAGIAFDSAGFMYVADTDNHRIRRISPDGVIVTVAGTGVEGYSGDGGPALSAELADPAGMAIGRGDLLYIADATCGCMSPATNGRVRVLNTTGGTITTLVHG